MKGSSVVFGYGIEKDADFDLVQYENSSAVVCKCREDMEEMFEEHRNDYVRNEVKVIVIQVKIYLAINDHICSWRESKGDYATKFPEFPEFPNWFGRSQIPDARTMTEHYKHNFYTVTVGMAVQAQQNPGTCTGLARCRAWWLRMNQ